MFYMLTSLQNSDKWQNRKHANSNLTLRKKLSAFGCNDAEKLLKQDNIKNKYGTNDYYQTIKHVPSPKIFFWI